MTSDLAAVEIASALAALHRRFCDGMRLPRPPGNGRGRRAYNGRPVVHDAEKRRLDRLAVYDSMVRNVEAARERSARMSACAEIGDIGAACIRYRDWLDHLIGGHSNDEEYEAAQACIKDARELVSIGVIAASHPESGVRRARAIADGSRHMEVA